MLPQWSLKISTALGDTCLAPMRDLDAEAKISHAIPEYRN